MKKIVLSVTAIALTLVFSWIFFGIEETETKTSDSVGSSVAKSQPKSQSSQGSFIDYSPDVVAKTTDTKILFFYAPWCPQCRALEKDILEQGVPSGVSIIKVDYDTNQDLRQKYGVTIQTTLVKIDDAGNLVQKYVAYDQPNLASVKEHLL